METLKHADRSSNLILKWFLIKLSHDWSLLNTSKLCLINKDKYKISLTLQVKCIDIVKDKTQSVVQMVF